MSEFLDCPKCSSLTCNRILERISHPGIYRHGHPHLMMAKMAALAAKLLVHQLCRCKECGHIWIKLHWPG